MESNIKGLVAAGHEMASELKAECGAVDMRSVAKLISDLATQLEVQLVRANALAAENAGIKSAIPQLRDIDADNDNMDDVSLAEDFGFNHAIERMRRQIPETPATDAFLAEVRAQGVEMYADNLDNAADDAERGGFDYAVKFLRSEASSVRLFAGQLRKGGKQ
ncbi:TPA: ead/Ea22-like family protein [Escherichia coli]|nr:ead/Ea22-like family protein [Escherichia coli]